MRPGRDPNRCPVCSAKFRGSSGCSRCGADLTPLMLLLAQSAALRRRSSAALAASDIALAATLATAAERLCSTQAGRKLAFAARLPGPYNQRRTERL